MTFRIATLLIPVCTALLAACGGNDRLTVDNAAASGTPAGVASSAGAVPPSDLAGRWTLSSIGTASCAMTLGAAQGATEGTIAPAGGCPFNFFTSRKWTYSETGLTIRDHNAQILAQLTPAGLNRFEGKTTAGQQVALAR
jgi:hypothetical protein